MKFVLQAFIGFIILLPFPGCEVCNCRKVVCPEFDNQDFKTYFPYQAGQTILFKNNSGDTDTMRLVYVTKSPSYEANRGCYNGSNGCNISSDLNAVITHSNGSHTNITVGFSGYSPFESSTSSTNIIFSIGNFAFQATGIGNEGLTNILSGQYHVDFFPQLTIGNTAFTNVQLITRDTSISKVNGFYKVFLSDGHGITAYEDYPSLTTWIKQ